MREELKQREAELEKSLDDKQQLKNQVQTLKEGLQNLKNTHRLQVSFTGAMFFHNRAQKRIFHWRAHNTVHFWVTGFEREVYLICTLIRKKWVRDDFQRMRDIEEINHQ